MFCLFSGLENHYHIWEDLQEKNDFVFFPKPLFGCAG